MIKKISDKMDGVMDWFNVQLGSLRTGRASSIMVENIKISSYGSKRPLKSLAGISIPDSSTIVIQPWDKSLVREIEKAISDSNLRMAPIVSGDILTVRLPKLTKERRSDLKKIAMEIAESAKVRIRQIRREANSDVKKEEGSGMSEDEVRKTIDNIQKMTDKQIKKIDSILDKKEQEIKTV